MRDSKIEPKVSSKHSGLLQKYFDLFNRKARNEVVHIEFPTLAHTKILICGRFGEDLVAGTLYPFAYSTLR